MAFTGRLGTDDSVLGRFVLGSEGEPVVGAASGSGTASGAATSVSTNAEVAAGAGAASDATISSVTLTGSAFQPDAFQTDAFQADAGTPAGVASGAGAAASATTSMATSAGVTTGAGAAHDATVSYEIAAFAAAIVASGSGVAGEALASVQPLAAAALGTGIAQDAGRVTVSPSAGVASAIGAANAPIFLVATDALAGVASGVGVANLATTESLEVGLATGTGRAINAMVITFVAPVAAPGAHAPGSGPAPSPDVGLFYAGVNLINDVLLQGSNFTATASSAASMGAAGTTTVRIRDRGHDYHFQTGQPLQWVISGQVEWDGYIAEVRRGYFMLDPHDPETRVRFFELHGVDRNILFLKRFLHDKVTPTNVTLTSYPVNTDDDIIVKYYMANHLDLAGDQLHTDLIEHVGTPFTDARVSGAAGWSWAELMRYLTQETGAVYYIDPNRHVVLTDVDTPNAPYAITDSPATPAPPVDFEDQFNRTESGQWGGDWVWDGGGVSPSVDGTHAILQTDTAFEEIDQSLPGVIPRYPIEIAGEWTLDRLTASTSQFMRYDLYDAAGDYVFQLQLVATNPGSLNAFLNTYSGSAGGTTVFASLATYENLPVSFRFQITEYLLRYKVWLASGSEPGSWTGSLSHAETQPIAGFRVQQVSVQTGVNHLVKHNYITVSGSADLSGEVGVRDLEIDFAADKMANDALAWGAGQGVDHMVFRRTTDAGSLASHGRWQVGIFNPTVWRQATIDRIAQSHVYGSPQSKRGGKDDAYSVRCTTFTPGFRVGMKAQVTSSVWGFTYVLPIRAMEVDFPIGHPRYRLTLSHEIDTPWTTFESWWPPYPGYPPPPGPPGPPDFPGPPDPWLPEPGGPSDPCGEAEICVVSDTFTRSEAGGWGTMDSGHTWETVTSGSGTVRTPTVDGEAGVLAEPGYAAGSGVGSQGEAAICGGDFDLETQEPTLVEPLTASFRFRYTGTWSATYAYNPVASSPTKVFAPGFAPSDTPSTLNGGNNWQRPHLQVGTRASIALQQWNIYNADGGLYLSQNTGNSVAGEQDEAILVSSQLEPGDWCNVKIHVASQIAYIKVWKDGTSEPAYQEQTFFEGTPDRLRLISIGQAKNANQSPFTIYVDDVCIGRSTYVGNALGLPGFATTNPGQTDDFDRNVSGGWGTGNLGTWDAIGYSGTVLADALEVTSGQGVLTRSPGEFAQVSMALPAIDTFPQEWRISFRHQYDAGSFAGRINGNELRLVGARESSADYLAGRWDYPFSNTTSTPRLRRSVIIDDDAASSDNPTSGYQTYSEDDPLQMRVRFEQDGDDYTVTVFGGSGDSTGLSVTASKPGFVPLFLEWEISLATSQPFGGVSTETFLVDQISLGETTDTSNCGSACTDTFTREEASGWGNWPNSGVIWQDYSGSGSASVIGGLGEILGSRRMLTLGMAPGLPVEILVKFRHQLTTSNAYNEFGIGDPETSGDINTLSYDDTGSNHRVVLDHNGTNDDFALPVGWTVDGGEWWWARYRMLSTTQSAGKMWPDSEPEPEDWQVQVTGAALGPEYEITVLNGTIGRLGVDSIEITTGNCPDSDCIDCSDGVDRSDLREGSVCENLFRVEVDEDGDTHLRATSQFEPRSTKVWADGKLLQRGPDYIESPFLGRIEVFSHVDLGGWGAEDPTRPVYMCYHATVIEPLDPPEPI